MRHEIAKTSVDPTVFPEAAHRLARRALREHQRAEQDALNAVQHAVRSGQALLKAYDLCEYGQWKGFFEMHFQRDNDKRLSPRTARTYMELARNWSLLTAQHPEGFSSQRHAVKALAVIVQADKPEPSVVSLAARGQSADASPAARSQTTRGKRRCSGPVWRASGPFVNEALRLVRSIDESLTDLLGKGYPLADEAENVRSTLVRLQEMIDTDMDSAEAQQAAGEWTWVAEEPARARRIAPAIDAESEADHDD